MPAVERLPVHHHSADYISFPLGSLGPLWYIWKWSSAHVYSRGRKQCCKLYYCLWRVSHFLIRSVFLVSKDNLFDVYYIFVFIFRKTKAISYMRLVWYSNCEWRLNYISSDLTCLYIGKVVNDRLEQESTREICNHVAVWYGSGNLRTSTDPAFRSWLQNIKKSRSAVLTRYRKTIRWGINDEKPNATSEKKLREKSKECHNHKQQPFPDTKRKREQTKPNKRKSNKRTKCT